MDFYPIDLIRAGAALYRQEMALLETPVLAWMWTMRLVFFGGVLLFPKREAVAVVGTMLATALLIFLIKGSFVTVPASHIGAGLHLILWTPLLVFLLVCWWRREPTVLARDRILRIWTPLTAGLLVISLLFDVREVVLAVIRPD